MTNGSLEQRYRAVLARIAEAERRHERPSGSVALLAVSKARPAGDVAALADLGQRRFGENYVQEALEKIHALAGRGLEWHFIGPVQSNKTRAVAEHFDWVHTLDREKIVRRLADQRPDHLPALNACIEVNVSGERSKSGVPPEAVPQLAEAVAREPRLHLRGLMALPAPSEDFEAQRAAFRRVASAQAALAARFPELDTLSLGTTPDFEAAIAEGASLVRIGTAIFGERTRP